MLFVLFVIMWFICCVPRISAQKAFREYGMLRIKEPP